MPESIGKQPKKNVSDKILYKKWWFWGAIVLAIAILVTIIIVVVASSSNKTAKTEYYDNEKVDVNGLTIKEACEKVREKGWMVHEVDGLDSGGYSVEKSDCSDETHKVSKVSYYDDKSIWSSPSVEIYFTSDKKKEDNNSDNNEDKTSEPEESSTSPSTSDSSSTNSNWREVLNDYETWVDEYVAFMKKYKNASSSDMTTMMNDYTKLLNQQKEWTDKLNNLRGELSSSDLTEYLNTLARINQKLSELY